MNDYGEPSRTTGGTVLSFRVHNELLAAAYHRAAVRDVAAIGAREAASNGWEEDDDGDEGEGGDDDGNGGDGGGEGKGSFAQPGASFRAADRADAAAKKAAAAREEAVGELREAVLEDLRRRPPKSIEVSEGVGGRDGEGRERGGGGAKRVEVS